MRYFTQSFYGALFAGRAIQEAFGIAQTALLSRAGSTSVTESFLLLSHTSSLLPFFGRVLSDEESPSDGEEGGPSSDDSADSKAPQQATMIADAGVASKLASLRDRIRGRSSSQRPPLPALPAPSGDFIGREMDLFAVLNHLLRRRLVVLCGAAGTSPGIGKTAVAEEVARWSKSRSQGMHSLVYPLVNLHPKTSSTTASSSPWTRVLKVMRQHLRSAARKDSKSRSPFEECVQLLKRQGNVLLVLDQADLVLSQAAFQAELQQLLAQCARLHMIVVSQQPVQWSGRYKAVMHGLQRLNDTDATELFLRRIGRALTSADVEEGGAPEPLDKSRARKALLNHPVQHMLDGHPRAIAETAAKVTSALPSLLELPALNFRAGDGPWRSDTSFLEDDPNVARAC